MKRIINSIIIAFSMYSRIPMPKARWTDENMSYAMCFFPWVGAVIGLITYGIYWVYRWTAGRGMGFGGWFFICLLVLLPVAVTGGIHMDGFLDTQDALSSYQSKERRLEILKDSHAGAFAIISCCVYFLLYTGVYSALSFRSVKIIALSFVLSRTLSGLSVLSFPQARKKGMAADFSKNASQKICRIVLIIYLILLMVLLLVYGKTAGAVCLLSAGGVYIYYYRMSITKFGGVTGDLAGYFLQICELVMAFGIVIVDNIL